MATCLEVITRAARYLGIVRSGETLGDTDADDLTQHLQDVIDGLPLFLSGEWNNVILTSEDTYTALDGDRISAAEGVTGSVELPNTYENDSGEIVPQRDLARVTFVDSGPWIYASSNGTWRPAYELTSESNLPFGNEDAAGLAALVAASAAPEYGAEISEPVIQRADSAVKKFRARFYREVIVPCDDAYLVMSEIGNGEPVAALFGE